MVYCYCEMLYFFFLKEQKPKIAFQCLFNFEKMCCSVALVESYLCRNFFGKVNLRERREKIKRRAKGGSILVNIVTFSHRTRCYPLKFCGKTSLNIPSPFTFVLFYVLDAMFLSFPSLEGLISTFINIDFSLNFSACL